MENLPWRIALTHREDGITISTIEPPCMAWYGKYETAISIDEGKWRIYKGYDTKEEALKGHEEVKNMTREEILNINFID